MLKLTINLIGLYKGTSCFTDFGIGVVYETNYHMNRVSVQFPTRQRQFEAYEIKLILRKYESLTIDEISNISQLAAVGKNNLFLENIAIMQNNLNKEIKYLSPLMMLLLAKKKIDIFGLINLNLAVDIESIKT